MPFVCVQAWSTVIATVAGSPWFLLPSIATPMAFSLRQMLRKSEESSVSDASESSSESEVDVASVASHGVPGVLGALRSETSETRNATADLAMTTGCLLTSLLEHSVCPPTPPTQKVDVEVVGVDLCEAVTPGTRAHLGNLYSPIRMGLRWFQSLSSFRQVQNISKRAISGNIYICQTSSQERQ